MILYPLQEIHPFHFLTKTIPLVLILQVSIMMMAKTMNTPIVYLKIKPGAFINIGEQKTVTFASLKPGSYTFQVKTILPDGTESKTPTSLHINILFPFYETWWFYMLLRSL